MNFSKYINELETNGFVLVPGLLDKNECSTYINELEEIYSKFNGLYSDNKNKTQGLHDKNLEKTVYNLHNKSSIWMDLFDHEIIHQVIGPQLQEGSYQNSEPFYLNNTSARTPLLGNVGQQIHVDSNLPGVNYAMMINALWYFEDSNAQNGATVVIPGTHTRREFAKDGHRYDEEIVIEAKAGDLLIFNGNLWHGGGPCTKKGTRWAGIFGYARWFIKPSFDMCRNTPEYIYDTWTEQQKRLMGFDLTPPLDEFSRTRRRTLQPEFIIDYHLPKIK
jgi:ectoine hydroxylase-related dioxygenase (phytanoyl-CoA dioxygenase family)